MPTPTLTMRKVMNQSTGIDLSVPSVREVEAPLGGISVEYEITVLTSLQTFKTSLHKESDVVHFSLFKAYREVEDFYQKLQRKFPLLPFPTLPRSDIVTKDIVNERREALDNLMKFIALHTVACHSSLFAQFIGIAAHKPNKASVISEACNNERNDVPNDKELEVDGLFTRKKKKVQDAHIKEMDEFEKDAFASKHIASSKQEDDEAAGDLSQSKIICKPSNEEQREDELFPKVKVDNSLLKSRDEISCGIPSKETGKECFTSNEDEDEEEVDIFEENKQEKLLSNNTERTSYTGLFQSEDDASDLLFAPQFKTEKNSPKFLFDLEASNEFDKSRQGKMKLFADQDYGGAITQAEEQQFFVSQDSKLASGANSLLASKKAPVLSELEQMSLQSGDNLEDLLHLDPLPQPKTDSGQSSFLHESSTGTALSKALMSKPSWQPIPKPRTKVLPNNSRPEVAPRSHLTKPVPQSKPLPPPKPQKLIVKTKPTCTITTGALKDQSKHILSEDKTEPGNRQNNERDVSPNLNELDILKYIEQEEKLTVVEPSLFD